MNESGKSSMDTRDRLVDAALSVVASVGVAGATSRQIATTAGTNLQAITYHFGSKDQLIAEALVGAVRDWLEPARSTLRGLAADPAGGLVVALGQLRTTLTEVLPRVPAYLEALALVPRSEEFSHQIRNLLGELRSEIAGVLRGLQDAGYLAGWIEPDAMAALVLAAADGTAIHVALDPDGIDLDATLGQVIPLLLAASTMSPPPEP